MTSPKLIVAHRGVRTNGHVNTLDAFERAIRLGADMLEFDVRRTGDGKIVVHHDDEIGGRPLASMDFATARLEADARGYRLPMLEDLLRVATGRVRLDVELKEGGYEGEVLELIFGSRCRVADFVVTSFDAATLARVREASPGVRLGLLVDTDGGGAAFERFAASDADFLAPHFTILDDELFRRAAGAGTQVVPWTVNEPGTIRRLLGEPVVAAVITDETADGLRARRELR